MTRDSNGTDALFIEPARKLARKIADCMYGDLLRRNLP